MPLVVLYEFSSAVDRILKHVTNDSSASIKQLHLRLNYILKQVLPRETKTKGYSVMSIIRKCQNGDPVPGESNEDPSRHSVLK